MRKRSSPSSRITLRDVAARVGVSTATVSNAFTRPTELSASLRARILQTARELGYPGPDPVARQLSTGRTGTVGVIFSEEMPYAFSDPTALAVFRGIASECQIARINLLLIATRVEHIEQEPTAPIIAALDTAAVDGFIVYGMAADSQAVAMARMRQLPIVVIDQPRLSGVVSVTIDDRAAAYELARSLVYAGHRHFGILSLSSRRDEYSGFVDRERAVSITYGTVALRLDGYMSALIDGGILEKDVAIWECAVHAEASGHTGTQQLLFRGPIRPTAILAMSDRLAVGAMQAARDVGLAIPQDLAVAGFDGIPDAGELGLSTVEQPFEEKGRAAIRLLQEIMVGNAAESLTFPAKTILRGSTGT